MTTFYICRHGQTENNKKSLFSGWIDTPLTEEGFRNAETTAGKVRGIHFDTIISSDLGRAFMTAYVIARGIGYVSGIERSKALREVNYGDFANKPLDTYPILSPEENADYAAPNGESLRQMQTRVLDYVRGIASEHAGKTILLVAHDGTINALRAAYNNESIGIADTVRNPYDSVARFEYENGRVISFNTL